LSAREIPALFSGAEHRRGARKAQAVAASMPDMRITCYDRGVGAPSRKTVVEEAGRVVVLKKELAAKQAQRDKLDQEIQQLERKLGQAEEAFDATWAALARSSAGIGSDGAGQEEPLTPGKLPHRVLLHMRHDSSHLYTASDIAADLKIRDVQQVRTALARLVGKGLVRRAGMKGEFTI
jgi:hypothetical protein